MHILRGIRVMMIRLITRATRHYELRATCFPRGGVPTCLTYTRQNGGASRPNGNSVNVQMVGKISQAVMNEFNNNNNNTGEQTTLEIPDQMTDQQTYEGEYISRNA